jgi:hypothetical protein
MSYNYSEMKYFLTVFFLLLPLHRTTSNIKKHDTAERGEALKSENY